MNLWPVEHFLPPGEEILEISRNPYIKFWGFFFGRFEDTQNVLSKLTDLYINQDSKTVYSHFLVKTD